jgi:hypothetical protein
MDWWNSVETVSKIQTALAIFLAVFGFVILTFKLRGDYLKRAGDMAKAEERAVLDTALQRTADDAHEKAKRLEKEREEERIRAAPRHFPMDKIDMFMTVANNGIKEPVTLDIMCLQTEDGEPHAFALEIEKALGWEETHLTIATGDVHLDAITILDPPGTKTCSLVAGNLQAAFEAIGFKCAYGTGAPHPGIVCIFVGKK